MINIMKSHPFHLKPFGRSSASVYLDTHFFKSTLICKMIFSRLTTLTSTNFGALWATRVHSTSFERSDSYLLGNSFKFGVKALLRYFIFAQKCDMYFILCGHRANQKLLAFLGFWIGLIFLPQFFALNQQIYVASTFFLNEPF